MALLYFSSIFYTDTKIWQALAWLNELCLNQELTQIPNCLESIVFYFIVIYKALLVG